MFQFVLQIPCRHSLSILSPTPCSLHLLPDGRVLIFVMDLECEREWVWCVWGVGFTCGWPRDILSSSLICFLASVVWERLIVVCLSISMFFIEIELLIFSRTPHVYFE